MDEIQPVVVCGSIEPMDGDWNCADATPKWLGIDEVHLLKHYRCVITDVENKSAIDIL